MTAFPSSWIGSNRTDEARLARNSLPSANHDGRKCFDRAELGSKTEKWKSPMGVSTGVAPAPMKDDQSRPITAGSFVDGGPSCLRIAPSRRSHDHRRKKVFKRWSR